MTSRQTTTQASFLVLLIILTAVTIVIYTFQFISPSNSSTISRTTRTPCYAPAPNEPLPLSVKPSIPQVLQSYAQTHNSIRQCFINSTEQCLENNQRPRAIIWKCHSVFCGGVGDRIRGLRLIFLLAISLNRSFFLEWPTNDHVEPFEITSALHPNSIDWRIPPDFLKHITETYRQQHVKSVIFKQSSRNVLYHPFLDIPSEKEARKARKQHETFPLNNTDFMTLFEPYDIIYISNRIQRSALLQLARNTQMPILNQLREQLKTYQSNAPRKHVLDRLLVQMLFKPSPIVKSAIKSRITSLPFLSVHARTGVDMQEKTSNRLKLVQNYPMSFTAAKLFRCIQHIQSPNKPQSIFIASDSKELKEKFRGLATSFNFTVLSHDGVVLHIDKEDERTKDIRCTAFVDVFADMIALGYSKTLVHLHSGFATTAVDFGSVGNSLEIDIRMKDEDIDQICSNVTVS